MEDIQTTQKANVCGTVEKVIYKNDENGFSVFTLKVNSKETVTAKGCLPDIFQGEVVSLTGEWAFHPKFGRQFNVQEYDTKMPSNVVGIRKYLASGLIKGIGPKFAERLVNTFGEQTLEVIDKHPERLNGIPGVGPKRISLIVDAWQDQKEISKVMVFLREKDVSTAFATKIYKTYGNSALDIIKNNPYRLVEDIWGIGFKSADSIALKMGLKPDSIERIKAGILHAISQATGNGHLYAEVEDVKEEVFKLLDLDKKLCSELLKKAMHQQYLQDKIKVITHKDVHYLTLPQYYYSEKSISNKG